MKMRRLMFASGVLTLLASMGQIAFANPLTVTLTGVQVANSTGTSGGVLEVYLTTSQAVINPAGCSAPDGYITEDPVIANAVYAGSLSALASGASVQLLVSTTQCAGNRPEIVNITIE